MLFPSGIAQYPPARAFHMARRKPEKLGILDRAVSRVFGGLVRKLSPLKLGQERLVALAATFESKLSGLDEKDLFEGVLGVRRNLLQKGLELETVAEAFALIREVAQRKIGLRHFDVQLKGGWAILNGMAAEMETGEGKTLTATLAAGTAALAGIPVHVISVNDYLTRRDAEAMGPVYQALGLTVGCVVQGSKPEERRRAYDCDITYASNKVIVFDYLRDRITTGGKDNPLVSGAEALCRGESAVSKLLQRGLFFAIVDEADSVLVDEARTPLILSGGEGPGEAEALFYRQAVDLAEALTLSEDYTVNESQRRVLLTDAGKAALIWLSEPLGPLWKGALRREEIVEKALAAKHLFKRDEHYLVADGKVSIVDEFTGRVMPDRSWEHGLHQLIEVREGCDITRRRETLARISYQAYFRRYLRLGGMTGTAREIRRELYDTYGLCVCRIPTHRPVQRTVLSDTIFKTEAEKWAGVVSRIQDLHHSGRPVLVGTRSVAASEQLSRLLTEKTDLPHAVLNAWKIDEEAGIVARAGQPGVITLATNMAGRGTDIAPGEGVKEEGGLHVILTERHEASRIDRQLAGRCARQGDPGSFEAMLSLEDPILIHRAGLLALAAKFLVRRNFPGWRKLGSLALLRAQADMEARNEKIRKRLLSLDERMEDVLAFSGRPD
jgi:preprotein translocase subunit SecA